MLRENNTNVTIQGKVLKSHKDIKNSNSYYNKIQTGESERNFQELYLKEQLEEGGIYKIKGEIKLGFGRHHLFVKDPTITKIS